MGRIPRRLVPVAMLAAITATQVGCAAFSAKPPTPAAEVSFLELNKTPVPPGERYYLLIFGSETCPRIPKLTHSWATVVKVPVCAPDATPVAEHHSISWMPATLEIRPWYICVEPGVNLNVHQSIEMAQSKGETVYMWGPFEIPIGLYRKGLLQKAFIDSGAIGYQCIDTIGEAGKNGNGSNCIHAITDADSRYDRQAYPLAFFGVPASENMLHQIVDRGAIADPYLTHDWVIPLLKLDCYDICRRQYEPRKHNGPLRWMATKNADADPKCPEQGHAKCR
jgi:hypothetical protein